MSDKNLGFSSHLFHKRDNDSNPITSTKPLTSVKRRFSATKMLNKAKDTTKSLVHEVKRHSLESKHSSDENMAVQPALDEEDEDKRPASLTSIEELKAPSNLSEGTQNSNDDAVSRTLTSRKKHYSLPIRRPFTIKKDGPDSSLSSFSTTSSSNTTAAPAAAEPVSSVAAAAAEAAILSGSERPGSFATACDFRLAKDKRNEEFHALFKSVPSNDLLIQGIQTVLEI